MDIGEIAIMASKIVFLALIAGAVALTIRNSYGFFWQHTALVVKQFRWRMYFELMGLFVHVIPIGIILWATIPFMKWGWLSLFYEHGGNMGIRPLTDLGQSESRILASVGIVGIIVLALVMPHLTFFEERAFRKGHYTWRSIIRQSIKFGFVHMIVGVPLFGAIMISCVGFYFATVYRKIYRETKRILTIQPNFKFEYPVASEESEEDEDSKDAPEEIAQGIAILESTAYHTMWNWILLSIAVILLIILQITR